MYDGEMFTLIPSTYLLEIRSQSLGVRELIDVHATSANQHTSIMTKPTFTRSKDVVADIFESLFVRALMAQAMIARLALTATW